VSDPVSHLVSDMGSDTVSDTFRTH